MYHLTFVAVNQRGVAAIKNELTTKGTKITKRNFSRPLPRGRKKEGERGIKKT
jgi:hypothetical protein